MSSLKKRTVPSPKKTRDLLLDYIQIARPDHWIKNIFMLPGIILALMVGEPIPPFLIFKAMLAFGILCFLSSANYTINEYLDAAFDKFHPSKQNRPGAQGHLSRRLVYLQYVLLNVIGLGTATVLGAPFLITAFIFQVMAIIYNVSPIRIKDRAYLDVVCESVNGPIRLLLGWYIVAAYSFPPSSALLAYWMGGAYLMAIKRYSEYRYINNISSASSYRRSFHVYKEDTLLLSSFFYALNATFFLGVFLIKYRIEYFVTLPFIALMFVWYMAIALRKDSAAQAPEKLYKERNFLLYTVFLWLLLLAMTFIDIPLLHLLIAPTRYD